MRKRFKESQIVAANKKHESGTSVKEICWALGISDVTFYNWEAKYGGMEASVIRAMKNFIEKSCNAPGETGAVEYFVCE